MNPITIADLVIDLMTNQRPVNNLLSSDIVLSQCIAATLFYAGYSDLAEWRVMPVTVPATPYPAITEITTLNESEWAIIKPLFMYYLERENALYLESSRGLGVDPFGRASSEVIGDINIYEADMPHKAFCCEIVTV